MSNQHCTVCGLDLDLVGERFELRPEVLVSVGTWPLCVGCVEDRLHRRLVLADLVGNTDLFSRKGCSPRILKRIYGERHWHGRGRR